MLLGVVLDGDGAEQESTFDEDPNGVTLGHFARVIKDTRGPFGTRYRAKMRQILRAAEPSPPLVLGIIGNICTEVMTHYAISASEWRLRVFLDRLAFRDIHAHVYRTVRLIYF